MTDAVETPRLRLRRWSSEDAVALAKILAVLDVTRYIGDGHAFSKEDTFSWMMRHRRHWDEFGFGLWAAELKETGALAGWMGLATPAWLPEVMPATEVGWLLDKPLWGRGLATEGGRASLDHAFQTLRLEEVVSICYADNPASERVMQKIGLHHERDTAHPRNGARLRIYAITSTEFEDAARIEAI